MRCYDLIVEGNDLVRLSSRSVRKFPIDLLGNGRFRMNARSNRTYCDVASAPPPPIVIPIVSEQVVTDIENRDQQVDPIAIPVAVKAGSLLVLTYNSWRAGPVPQFNILSITDTQGNVWQKAVSADKFSAGSEAWITSEIWYAQNCNAGMTTVIPVTTVGTGPYWSAAIQEVSGIVPVGALDTVGFNLQDFEEATVTADDVSSQNNTLVVGVASQDGGPDLPWTTPAGYTEVYDVQNGSTDEPGHSDYKVESVAQLETILWLRGTAPESASCIAVFKGITP